MKLVKLVIVIAALYLGWKYVLPKVKEKLDSSSTSSSASNVGSACVDRAAAASEAWGSGLGRFVNPPIDLNEWGGFRADIETKIARAQAECGCAEESCRAAKSALGDLRALIAEIDAAARSGMPPPSDAVQRQEAIDEAITAAGELAKSGK
jgi:hypothetical protein